MYSDWGTFLHTTVHDHFQKAAEARLSVGETNTHIAMPSAPAPPLARRLVSLLWAQGLEPQLKTTSVVDGRHEDSTMGKKAFILRRTRVGLLFPISREQNKDGLTAG